MKYILISLFFTIIMDWINCFLQYDRIYRTHALERMYQRNISFDELNEIKNNIKVIEEYYDDKPYPSCLVLGFTHNNKPIHIVFSVDLSEKNVVIITVYIPDQDKWTDNFQRRIS